ncbi:MAG: 30S ribosomal protein S4 [Patescibacteria group bacterium]|jgi:small subunit ribosomal protein S4
MGRKLDSTCSQCRRTGVKLFLKGDLCLSSKCTLVKRNYPPGVHGVKGRSKLTSYGEQLQEKQKAKRIYGILEKQFSKYYREASRRGGENGENLMQILEMRLDNVVYRLGFAASRPQARQMVSHGFFTIKDKKVNIPSYQVRIGEVIALSAKAKKSKLFQTIQERLTKALVPSWLGLEPSKLSAKVLDKPKAAEMENSFSVKSIIEFYSR